METKHVNKLKERSTYYDNSFTEQLRSTEHLQNSLSVGSTNRLRKYQNDLSKSRGIDQPLFDNGLKDLLFEYVWDPSKLKEALNYLNSLRDADGFLFSRDLKLYCKTQESMERFAEADHPSFRWNVNYNASLKSLQQLAAKCRLKPELYFSDDEIRRALPKTDTHSGYTWLISGKKTKGDNIEGLHEKFKDRTNRMMNGEIIQGQPILIAFRTQASGEFDDEGGKTGTCKHKTRVVSMYDLCDIVDELQFSNPFQKWFNTQWMYAGGKDENAIARIISAYRAEYQKFMSVDYSSFDQTISSWLIEDAFSVVKAAFVLTPAQELVFDQVVDRFIHKDFILNEGVLHSDKGVPSGSMFTQIIDSIVNILVVSTYFKSINRHSSMIAMGDDNAIFCDADVDIEHLASYIQKNFGLIIKTDDKSNEGLNSEKDVKFLSRYWTKGGCWRHPNQLVSRLLFPERRRDYSKDVKPEHVLFAYILTYRVGMTQLMDINRFMREHPISRSFVMDSVDSRYLPGSLAYIREYTV